MSGAHLETIQRHLGHQDVKTTMVYLHVTAAAAGGGAREGLRMTVTTTTTATTA
jgi:integrase